MCSPVPAPGPAPASWRSPTVGRRPASTPSTSGRSARHHNSRRHAGSRCCRSPWWRRRFARAPAEDHDRPAHHAQHRQPPHPGLPLTARRAAAYTRRCSTVKLESGAGADLRRPLRSTAAAPPVAVSGRGGPKSGLRPRGRAARRRRPLAQLLLLDEALELLEAAAQVAAHGRGGDVLGEPAAEPRAGDAVGESELDPRAAGPGRAAASGRAGPGR